MLSSEIVLQIAEELPKRVPYFTDNFEVNQLTVSSGTATAEFNSSHTYQVGDAVNVYGVVIPLEIASFVRVGSLGTITTVNPHDFTFGSSGAISGTGRNFARVSGFNEPEFQGDFTIIGVTDRYKLLVEIENSGPTVATGSAELLNGSSYINDLNGIREVLSVGENTITFSTSEDDIVLDGSSGINIRGSARVSSVVSPEIILDTYTEHLPDKLWAFVVLEDVVASKNREIMSDGIDNLQRGNHYRQQIIQPVTIYIVFPTAAREIAGRDSRDLAETLFKPLCESLLFKSYNSNLYSGANNPLHFSSHGFYAYNKAYYIHQYTFQQMADLQYEDTVGASLDTAFRDIDLNIDINEKLKRLTATINLDEESLN